MRDKEDIRWMLDEAIVRRNEWKSWLAEIRQDPSTSRKPLTNSIVT